MSLVKLFVKDDSNEWVPATASMFGGGGGSGTSDTTEATQLLIKTGVGAPADAAASSDSGTFSIIALLKRCLGNWTTLLARVPTLGRKTAAGSIPVTLPTDVPTDLVADSAGTLFSPASCSHAYTYDGANNMTTDTATDGAVVRVKTLTYTSGNMTSETKWVVQ